MKNSLGDDIPFSLIVMTFRKGLDDWLHGKLDVFQDLPFQQYKDKAEFLDLDVHERGVGPYAPKREQDGKPSNSKSGTCPTQKSGSNSPKSSGKPAASTLSAQLKPKPSKDQLRKEGKCYKCHEKGHLTKECPKKKEKDGEKLEISAISLAMARNDYSIKPRHPKRPTTISSRTDERSYREVVLGKPKSTEPQALYVPTIAVASENGEPEEAEAKPPPMVGEILINGVPIKMLFDTGSSDDFLRTHFANVNRVSVQKHQMPVTVQ